MDPAPEPFPVPPEAAGQTLAAVLRARLPGQSWAAVRKLIEGRRAEVDGAMCMDPARRLKAGEVVALRDRPVPVDSAATPAGVVIRHLDDHVVVVEKPSGINTVRHPAEVDWTAKRRELSPTLQDVTQWAIAERKRRKATELPRLRVVQRLDKETSGLVVFARSHDGERELGAQFRAHSVTRRYLTVVPGLFTSRKIESSLVRDRGDGRRGSTTLPRVGKVAVTHVEVRERLPRHTLLVCRLETGRTHQIRIHLAEAGHPVCGEPVYNRTPDGRPVSDAADGPRLALHAFELGFAHPITRQPLRWEMPLPEDLELFLNELRSRG